MGSRGDDHQFVFIGGLPGSGATRMEALLGRHPNVSTLSSRGRRPVDGEALQRVLPRLPQSGRASSWEHLASLHLTEGSPECRSENADALLRSWGAHWDLSKRVLVERSSSDLVRSRLLQGLFPDAFFIMVTRHPAVIVEAGRNRSLSTRSTRLRRWLDIHEKMADDLAHVRRFVVIRYEDLLTSTEDTYRRVLEELDLPPAALGTHLAGSGNEAYYRTFSSPVARMSIGMAANQLEERVERFGYGLNPPFVLPASPQGQVEERELVAVEDRELVAVGGRQSVAVEEHPLSAVERRRVAQSPGAPFAEPVPAGESLKVDGELERAARGGVAAAVGIFVGTLLQFAFVVVASHALPQATVGALLEAIALFTICSLTLGADIGLLRFAPVFARRRPADLGRLHTVALIPSFVVSSVFAAFVYVYAPQLVSIFFHHTRTAETVTALRIVAVFLPPATISAVLCASLRTWSMRASVLAQNFLQAAGRLVLLLAFVAVGVSLQLAAVAYGIPLIASVVVAGVLVARRVATVPTLGGEPSSYRSLFGEFWRFSSLGLFGMVFSSLIVSLDVLLVGAFLSTRDAAAYAVASRYLLAGTFAVQAVIQSVSRRMSNVMDARNYKAANEIYQSSTWWTIAVSWPPLLSLAVFAPLFMSVFGHGYLVAAPALVVLSLSMLANTGTGANGILVQIAGRSGLALAVLAGGFAINLGLDLWLIPTWGLKGAAIGWTATILETAVLLNAILWFKYRIHPFGRGYAIVAGASLGCFGALGLVARLVFGTGVGSFVLFGVVSSALYGLILYSKRRELNLNAFSSLYSGVLRRARRLLPSLAPAGRS